MPNLAVVDMEGKNVGTIELAESVFGIEPNAAVMHQMVVNYLAAQRQGTQSALTRSEVSGGGKKAVETEGYRPCKTGVQQELRSGHTAALYSLRSQEIIDFP